MIYSRIAGTGRCLPERIMSNEDLEKSRNEAVIILGWIESCLPATRRPFVSLERDEHWTNTQMNAI